MRRFKPNLQKVCDYGDGKGGQVLHPQWSGFYWDQSKLEMISNDITLFEKSNKPTRLKKLSTFPTLMLVIR